MPTSRIQRYLPVLFATGLALVLLLLFTAPVRAEDEEINVEQLVIVNDDDTLQNDCGFWAHVGEKNIQYVRVGIYDNLGREVANGSTDKDGLWLNKNMTNGDYNWSSSYQGHAIRDNGTFDVQEGVRDIQAHAILTELRADDNYNDVYFNASDDDGNGVEGIYCQLYYEVNGTLYDEGWTDDDGMFTSMDLPLGNYTFNISYQTNVFNSGWLHSYDEEGGGEPDEWFDDWDNETEDTGSDGKDDTITIYYDPDTELDEVEVQVQINIYNETNSWQAFLSEDHTIYAEEYDWLEQNWTATENGTYRFEVSLYDEDWNLEDNFTIHNVRLYAEQGGGGEEDKGIINVGQWVRDRDNDDLLNDAVFRARIEGNATQGVNITIYDNLDREVANGSTDGSGRWVYRNLSNGDYHWDATYRGRSQENATNGTFDITGVRDIQAYAELFQYENRNGYDDVNFMAYDRNGDGVEDVDCELYWEGNNTLYTSGQTNSSGSFLVQNLPLANFTFDILYQGDSFNSGWLHSYGKEGGGGTGDDNEWFEDWDYDTSDSDNDTDDEDDTIHIFYDPDTEAARMDVRVTVNVKRDDSWVDYLSEEYTIYGSGNDWFSQNWTATESGDYDFEVTLYDEDWNLEDYFELEDIYLRGTNPAPEGVINLDQRVFDGDDNTILNDCDFHAHVKGDGVESVNISIYNSLGNLVANGTTDHRGQWTHKNLSNGDYNWSAKYEGQLLEDNGTFDVDVGFRDVQGYAEILVLQGDGNYNDVMFRAYDEDGDPVEDVDCSIYYLNGTLYASGSTDEEGIFELKDLPLGNYSFEIDYQGDTFNIGWLHSYGDESGEDEDEWFDDWEYETEDTGDDGKDDTITFHYDPDTEADKMNVTVLIDVYLEGDYLKTLEENYTIFGDDGDWFSQEFTAEETGEYDFYVYLYDKENNLEDDLDIESITLYKEEDVGDVDEWFEDWEYETKDTGDDGGDDSIRIGYDPDTEASEMDVEVVIEVYYEGGSYDDISEEYTIYGDDTDSFDQEWTADRSGTYDFYVYLYDRDGKLEDEFQIEDIELYKEGDATSPYLEGFVTEGSSRDEDDPVEGASVELDGKKSYSTTTDEDGYYYIECEEDDYDILITHDDYQDHQDTVSVEEGENTYDAHLTPVHRTGKVYGEVTDKATGDPVEDATLSFTNKDDESVQKVKTDDDGYYDIELLEGDYDILIEHDHYDSQEDEVTVELDGEHERNYELQPEKRRLSGTVGNHYGEELKGITVSAVETNDGSRAEESTTTDQDGLYQLFLVPGSYNVSFSHNDFTGVAESVEITLGEDLVLDMTLEYKAGPRSIQLFMNVPSTMESGEDIELSLMVADDSTQEALEDASVRVRPGKGDADPDRGDTDSEGRFDFFLTADRVIVDTRLIINITVEMDHYRTSYLEKEITIKAGEPDSSYKLSLLPAILEQKLKVGDTLSLEVTVRNDGNVQDRFSLEISGDREDWGTISLDEVSLDAGEQKSFQVEVTVPKGIPSGIYTFKLTATSEGDSSETDSTTFRIEVEESEDDDSPGFALGAVALAFVLVAVERKMRRD